MYPLLPTEVDVSKIKISDINYSDNKQFCHITYHQNGILYLQSPLLKFIEPIIIQQSSRNNHKSLFLFLTPQDSNTFNFIELVKKIEKASVETINKMTNKVLVANPLIKIHRTEEANKQIYMYIKITLLDQTKIEYNNKLISIDELNNLVRKVNLKVIFELNMLWISQTKIGIYLKPIKLKVIDIIDEPDILFRDEDSPIHNNLLYTEVDNIHNIINNNAVSLNESIFKGINENTDNFIKPPEQNINFQKKLQDELFIINNSSDKELNKLESISSSSSICIEQISRKKTTKEKKPISNKSESISSSSSINIEQLSRKKSNKQNKTLLNNNITSSIDS